MIAGLAISEVDGTVFVKAAPLTGRDIANASTIPACIAEAGLAHFALNPSAIERAILDFQQRPDAFVMAVGERSDARIAVEIAPDAMSASLHLLPARGGKPATIEDVVEALALAGVNFGLDHAAVMEACRIGEAFDLVVAQGHPVQEGKDSDFVELVPQTSNRTPKVDADGLIDYREHDAITVVTAGDALMRRIPPIEGREGHTVRGERLMPRPVRDEPFSSNLSGASVSHADPNLLTASISGVPVRVAGGINVEPVLHLPDVSLATGNIYFDGTVQIDGDVHPKMKVEASGDIFVGGTADGSQLTAGGNVVVRGGIIAASQVRAGGALSARFAQSSNLFCGTVLTIHDAAIDCQLESGNQVLVGVRASERGRLIGGTVKSRMLVRAPVMGSDKAAVTRIEVGSDPELEARIEALQERIKKEKANEDNLQKLTKHLESIKDPKGMLPRVRAAWQQCAKAWSAALHERAAIEPERYQLRSARIEVLVQTVGSLDLRIGSRRLITHEDYSRGAFCIDKSDVIVFTDGAGLVR